MRRLERPSVRVSTDMRKLAIIIFGVLMAAAVRAEDVDRTLDADPDGKVDISNTAGSVTVEGWSRAAVQVTGTLGNEAEKLIFERHGDEVIVEVKLKHGRHSGGRDSSSHITVYMPEGGSLDVEGVSADIDVKGVRGEQDLQTVSGQITTRAYQADVEAENVSGDISIVGENDDADVDLVTVSGDIAARDLSGVADLETVNGSIALSGGSFSEVDMETVNGRIDFRAGLRPGGELDVDTVNGRVDVNFVGDVSATFGVETFNGRIKNCFGPKPERVSEYSPGWELSFTEGKGDGRVRISTLNGGVNICK